MNRLCHRLILGLALLGAAACGDNMSNNTPDAGADAPVTPDAPPPDGPEPDAPPPLVGIEGVQSAPDGAVDIEVTGVLVTYIKPEVGNDPAGFFVQDGPQGPAVFVSIDPTTLDPSPQIGDNIDFHVSSVATLSGLRHADAIDSVVINSSGNDTTALLQDISGAADVVDALDTYESEYVTVRATLAAGFVGAGAGHQAAQIDTAGLAGNGNYRLRVPNDVAGALGLIAGCQVAIGGGIMWRFLGVAQVSIWEIADLDVVNSGCPAPTVVGAFAIGPTEVRVDFNQPINPASLVDVPGQFTFDNGLAAVSGVVSGSSVTLTTTAQTSGVSYTVTVADTVQNLFFGAGVDAASNTAEFSAFVNPVSIRINEVLASAGGTSTAQCDLVELRVLESGSLEGYQLLERGAPVVTFPAGFNVSANDLIVVHWDVGDCNPDGSPIAETTAPDENPAGTFSTNFDTAFDFYSTDTSLTQTDNVLAIVDPAGTILDAVLVSDDTSGSAAAASETAAESVRAAGEWLLSDGTLPAMNFYVDDNFNANAAQDLNAAATGSIQRINDADTNTILDWSVPVAGDNPPSTFGLLNVGQTAL